MGNRRQRAVDVLLVAHGKEALRYVVDALQGVAARLVVGQDHVDLVGRLLALVVHVTEFHLAVVDSGRRVQGRPEAAEQLLLALHELDVLRGGVGALARHGANAGAQAADGSARQ